MPSAKRNERGTWETLVFMGRDENGKRKYKHITARTRKECEQLAAYYSSQKNNEIPVMDMTVAECVDNFIGIKEKTLSPKTIREYKSYRRSTFQELWDIQLKDLTEVRVQQAVDEFGRDHKPKTVKNRWRLYCEAISYYWRDFNFRIQLPSIKRKRLDMPEESDIMRMLKDVEGQCMEIPLLLAITCGMRRGEISALNLAEDVNYEKRFVRVSKDMVLNSDGEWVVKPPKTEAGNRNVPCPQFVLDKLKAARDDPKFSMPVPNTITRWFWAHKGEYGITCTFHGLRHYYVSVMTDLGVPENYMMERVGHTTSNMLKLYQEYRREKEVEINRDMDKFFSGFGKSLESK